MKKMMKKRILSLFMALALIATTLFGNVSVNYVKAEESNNNDEVVVAIQPWAWGKGTLNTTDTYSEKGYTYANVISGSNDSYSGRLMSDVDLSIYSEIRFALKSDGTSWYEIGKVADDNFSMIANNTSEWVEIKFVDEGNGYFQVYVKKESQTDSGWVNKQISLNSNLSDLQMKFALSGTLVMTEVRGKLRTDAKSSLKSIRDCAKDGEGTEADTVKPIYESSKITQISTTWAYNKFYDLGLNKYKKLKFYAKNLNDGEAYIEMKVGQDETYISISVTKLWTEICMTKNEDSTWNIDLAGNRKISNASLSNLNEIKINFGSATYYMTELFAVKEPVAPTGTMVVSAPWAYEIGTMSNNETYEDGGYQYATKVAGSTSCYAGTTFSDVDLSIYSEVRFALKSINNGWYEIGKVSDGNYSLIAGNGNEWTEIKLVDEGNGYFETYVDGNKKDSLQLSLNANLNELQMKYSSTSGTLLYMTEVRGTLRENATSSLKVVADSFNNKTGEDVTDEKPIYESTKCTKVQFTQWENYSQLADLSFENYSKVIFYTRRTDSAENIWFEIKKSDADDNVFANVIGSKWVEIKYLRNSDDTWDLYVGGSKRESNITMSNLSNTKAKYGTGTYIFSQVFAVEKNKADEPEKTYETGDVNKDESIDIIDLVCEKKAVCSYTEDNKNYNKIYDLVKDNVLDNLDLAKLRNIIATKEVVIAANPWAYCEGNTDTTALSQVRKKGYEQVTTIDKNNNAYATALMTDVDLSIYKEVRFSLKSDGSTWWEICKAEDNFNNQNIASNNGSEWVEVRLTMEKSEDIEVLRLYVNGKWTATTLPCDSNLSDLKMKYLLTGKLMMTELRGKIKSDSTSRFKVIKNCAKDAQGTVSYTELPIYEAEKSTLLTESWNHSQTLPSIDLTKYGIVKFYVKNSENSAKYLELNDGKSEWNKSVQLSQNWAEVKFVVNEDGTWNVYLAGNLIYENLSITNTNRIYISYGSEAQVYISEVFAMDKSFF